MAMARIDDIVEDNPLQPAGDSRTPGALLREARERAGLSRSQLAEETNLMLAQVTAIEEDRYDQLPGDTFTIGYLRNYARAVAFDADRAVQAFFALRPQSRPIRVRVAGTVSGEGPHKPLRLDNQPPRRHYWSLSAAGLLLAALWSWHQIQEPVEMLPLTADVNGIDLPLPGGLETAALADATGSLLDSVELMSSSERPAMPMPAVATMESQGAAAPVALATTSPSADNEPVIASDQLNLRFTADCWVEVKDRDNRVLLAALKRADEQLVIEGRGPFKVLLGFAPGVEMAFNGQPVDIETARGARSARLIVGNS